MGTEFALVYPYSGIKDGFPSCSQMLDLRAIVLHTPRVLRNENCPSSVLSGQLLACSLTFSWHRLIKAACKCFVVCNDCGNSLIKKCSLVASFTYFSTLCMVPRQKQVLVIEVPKMVWENYSFRFWIFTNQKQTVLDISAAPQNNHNIFLIFQKEEPRNIELQITLISQEV